MLALLGQGATNSGIARALRVSEKTVEAHLTHLYEKLGVQSRAQAALRAHALHLLPSGPIAA